MEPKLIECPYYVNHQTCSLGLHDFSPTEGNCKACIEAGENNEKYAREILEKRRLARLSPPSKTEMLKSFAKSIAEWRKRGYKIATREQFKARLAICQKCIPHWDSSGYFGTGRCRECGCSTQIKLRLAHISCPEGKWGPTISPEQIPNPQGNQNP